MQFIVTAYDFDDENAINRRLLNREAHLLSFRLELKLMLGLNKIPIQQAGFGN